MQGEQHSCRVWWAGSSKTSNCSCSQLYSFSNLNKHEEEVRRGRKQGDWNGHEDLSLTMRTLFTTFARELRKVEKMLRCQVKVQSGAPGPSQTSEL